MIGLAIDALFVNIAHAAGHTPRKDRGELYSMKFYYFAYGSNMLTNRLRAPCRCPSAKLIGTASKDDYVLEFNKRSKDGSGKATLRRETGSGRRAVGVVFEIERAEKKRLDQAEGRGKGYDRCDSFIVRLSNGGDSIDTACYVATETDDHLRPYDWYLALVVGGAREHHVDEEYIAHLSQIPYEDDKCLERHERKVALEALEKSGFVDYRKLID